MRKYTYEDVKNIVEKEGYELLSKEEEINQIILENLLRDERGKLYSIKKFKERLENDDIYQLDSKRIIIEGKKITHYKIIKKEKE